MQFVLFALICLEDDVSVRVAEAAVAFHRVVVLDFCAVAQVFIMCDVFFCLACAVLNDEALQALLDAVCHRGTDERVLVFYADGNDVVLIVDGAADFAHDEVHQVEVFAIHHKGIDSFRIGSSRRLVFFCEHRLDLLLDVDVGAFLEVFLLVLLHVGEVIGGDFAVFCRDVDVV